MDKREEDSRCPMEQSHCAFGYTGKTFWKGKEKGHFGPTGRTVKVSTCKGGPKYYGRTEHKWSVPLDL